MLERVALHACQVTDETEERKIRRRNGTPSELLGVETVTPEFGRQASVVEESGAERLLAGDMSAR